MRVQITNTSNMSREEPLDFTMKTLKKERLPESEPTYIFENYPYPVPVYPYFYPSAPTYPILVPKCSGSDRSEQFEASTISQSPSFYHPKTDREPNSSPSDSGSLERSSYEVTTTTLSPTYLMQHQLCPAKNTCRRVSQEECSTPNVMADVDILAEDPDYIEFENNAFRAMAERNGGSLLGSNPRMRRVVGSCNSTTPDDSYRKQREKNNLAAKQSRDRRKKREMQLAFKVTYLSNKIARLKQMLSTKLCSRCQQRCDVT